MSKKLVYTLKRNFQRLYIPEIAVEVRGTGLMLGLQVRQYAQKIMMEAFQQGLIFNTAGGDTLRFLPPLIINRDQIDEACKKLHKTLKIILKSTTV